MLIEFEELANKVNLIVILAVFGVAAGYLTLDVIVKSKWCLKKDLGVHGKGTLKNILNNYNGNTKLLLINMAVFYGYFDFRKLQTIRRLNHTINHPSLSNLGA